MYFRTKLNFEQNKEYWINVFFLFTGFLLSLGIYWTYDLKLFLYCSEIIILILIFLLIGKKYMSEHRTGVIITIFVGLILYSCSSPSTSNKTKIKESNETIQTKMISK